MRKKEKITGKSTTLKDFITPISFDFVMNELKTLYNVYLPSMNNIYWKMNIVETVFRQLQNWRLVKTKIRSHCGLILNVLSILATLCYSAF